MPLSVIKTNSIDSTAVTALQTPAGTVGYFGYNTAPSGWLKANGAAVSRTTYSALFAAIGTTFGSGDGSTTFNIPDMRGEFPRGWDDSRGVDSGRTFGSAQLDQMQKVTGSMAPGVGNSGARLFSPGSAAGALNFTTDSNTLLIQSTAYSSSGYLAAITFDNSTSPNARVSSTTSGETRSRNIALLACIKY